MSAPELGPVGAPVAAVAVVGARIRAGASKARRGAPSASQWLSIEAGRMLWVQYAARGTDEGAQ